MKNSETYLISGEFLFKMHTEKGFSLTDSLFYIKTHIPNSIIDWSGWFKASRSEEKRSGMWGFYKSCDVIEESIQDSMWHQSLDEIIAEAWLTAVT